MIMESPRRGREARAMGLLAGLGLAGWAGFALSGAAAEEIKEAAQPQVTVSASGDKDVLVQRVQRLAFAGPDGEHEIMFHAIGAPGADGPMPMVFQRQLSPETLASFAAAHPAADADSDGAVTQYEHDAYLVALAMARPEAVLEQFPHVDRDQDGALSADEAVGLVTAPPMMHMMGSGHDFAATSDVFALHGAQPHIVRIEKTDDGNGNVTVRKFVSSDAAAAFAAGHDVAAAIAGAGIAARTVEVDVNAVADGAAAREAVAVVRVDDGSGEVRQHVLQLQPQDGELPQVSVEAESVDGQTVIKLDRGGQVQTLTIDPQTGAVSGLEEGDPVQVWVADGTAELPEAVQARLAEIHEQLMADGAVMALGGEQAGALVELHAAAAGSEGEPFEVELAPVMQMLMDPARWLLENVDAAPTAQDVGALVETVREAPLAAMLKLHPEADLDGDGRLSEQERDRFIEKHMSLSRQKLLERYPEADANGDGVLTNEELREYFRTHGPRGGKGGRFKVFTNDGHGGTDVIHRSVTRERAADPDE